MTAEILLILGSLLLIDSSLPKNFRVVHEINCAIAFHFAVYSSSVPPEKRRKSDNAFIGDPLFLTPLIKNGEIEEAKELSRVGPLDGTNVTSYSGFITVDETYNSNMFFWFFPSENDDAPVLLWLQGGPGLSSLFGLFTENGPFSVNRHLVLEPREFAWTKSFSVLYVDNPVGTGFSFTEDDAGYSRNQVQVAENLYECLQQFFNLFPELRANPFYVTGESYAGKYVPAIGYKIHTENQTAKDRINLKGVAIGDGLCDPIIEAAFVEWLCNADIQFDETTKERFQSEADKQRRYILEGDHANALASFDSFLAAFDDVTGLTNHRVYSKRKNNEFHYGAFLQQPEVRNSIHVGRLSFNDGIEDRELEDFTRSVKPWLEALLVNYEVLVYSGWLDVATLLTYNFVGGSEWSGADAFRGSGKQIWKVESTDDRVAGNVKQSENLTMVVVRDAGHMISHYQPRAALDMINRFVYNQPWA